MMHPKKIESTRNPALKNLLNPKACLPYFAIEGPNLLEAAIESERVTLGDVFVTERGLLNHAPLISRATGYGNATGLYEIADHIMERASGTVSPPGLMAMCRMRPYGIEELDLTKPVVVLDAIQDPGNVGTIIRTAQAAGSGGLVLMPGTADPFSPKALRASAGGALIMPVVIMADVSALRALNAQGVRIIHAVASGGTLLYQAELTPPFAIVFGNEARGISGQVMEMPAAQISLPVLGGAESLNVAASVAVFLYEALRRTL